MTASLGRLPHPLPLRYFPLGRSRAASAGRSAVGIAVFGFTFDDWQHHISGRSGSDLFCSSSPLLPVSSCLEKTVPLPTGVRSQLRSRTGLWWQPMAVVDVVRADLKNLNRTISGVSA